MPLAGQRLRLLDQLIGQRCQVVGRLGCTLITEQKIGVADGEWKVA